MAQRIEGVEIFATGRHRGSEIVQISENDLNEMVASFNALGHEQGFKPVLKLGHEDVQKFFGQRKGAPNLGFVEKVWKEGNKLLANFANVPDAVVDLIRQGRYNAVSIEMFPKTQVEGKTFSNVLTAVALLGAELPAVKGLKDLAATLFTEEPETPDFQGNVETLMGEDEMATFTQEQLDTFVEAAVAKAKDEVRAEFDAKVAELEGKVTEADKAKETAENALREFEDTTRKNEAEAMVDNAIEEGKLLPKQKDEALAFALTLNGTVKFGDTEKSAVDVFKTFIEGLPKKIDLDEHGSSESEKETPSNASEEVDFRARKFMSDDKDLSYIDARRKVLDDNPKLKQRYFEMED